MKSFYIAVVWAFCFLMPAATAQISQTWVFGLGSTSGDGGYAVTTDPSGNVYITGYFTGTVDFDRGAGTYNLSSAGNNDVYLAKYSSSGSFLWAHAFGAGDTDIGETVATDAAGNVYLGLSFGNTIDMDPGANVAPFTSPGFSNSILAKFDANGNYLWAVQLESPASTGISEVETDAAGNVFITGSFHGTVDFDPGTATNALTANGNSDIFFAKYDANGNYQFARGFGAGAFDTGLQIDLDTDGAILVSGYYRLTVDFDPGTGVFNLTASGTLNDIFFARYNAAGDFLWARTIGSTSNDIPGGIIAAGGGTIIVCGGFTGTVDFDPGAGSANLTSSSQDIFIAKYDVNGNYLWAKKMGGGSSEAAYAITGDNNGGFYITGEFPGTIDFDPDGATVNVTSNGSTDVFIARYTSNGNLVSAGHIGGPSSDFAQDISLVDANNVMITGFFQGNADFDPGTGVNIIASAGTFDVYFGKYSSSPASLPVVLLAFYTRCINDGIEISWTTGQEQNSKNYVVEKSYDGSRFEHLATVPAAGMSNNSRSYSIIDRAKEKRRSFYRLRQNDLDGRYQYSKVIGSNCQPEGTIFRVYPNPAQNELIVVAEGNAAIVNVSIFDAAGRKVKSIHCNNCNGQIKIDIRLLQHGLFTLVVDDGIKSQNIQFLKG